MLQIPDSYVPYAGSGSAGPFAVSFKWFDDAEIEVVRCDPNGVETPLQRDVDYTITGEGAENGGTVMLSDVLPSGFRLYIGRKMQATQLTEFEENRGMPASTQENALDRIVMMIQELAANIERAPLAKRTTLNRNAIFPESVNALLGWGSDGKLTNYPLSPMTVPVLDHIGNYHNNLTEAATMIGASLKTLLVATDVIVEESLTLPPNLTLWIHQGAKIDIAAGATLTVQGEITGERRQMFTGDGTVVFAAGTQAYPEWFGCTGGGLVEDGAAYQKLLNALPAGGVVVHKAFASYLLNTNLTHAYSNLLMELNWATLRKTSGSGYIFKCTGSAAQKNIVVRNGFLQGYKGEVAGGWSNSGLAFATNHGYDGLEGLWLENLILKDFGQYGVNIASVSRITVRNVEVVNHGSTAASAAGNAGIGFVIFPRDRQSFATIDDLRATIDPATTVSEMAGIKVQNCSDIQGNDIHARNSKGSEYCMVISQTHNSAYSQISSYNQCNTGGLTLMSFNSGYPVTWSTVRVQASAGAASIDVVTAGLTKGNRIGFVMDDGNIHWTKVDSITDSDTLVIAAAVPTGRYLPVGASLYLKAEFSVRGFRPQGEYANCLNIGAAGLVRCDLSDVDLLASDGVFGAADNALVEECRFADIRCKSAVLSSTGVIFDTCELSDVTCTEGALQLPGNSNKLKNITLEGAGRCYLKGNLNTLKGLASRNSSSTGLEIEGDGNDAEELTIQYPTSNPIKVVSGSANRIGRYSLTGGPAISDAGTGTIWDDREITTEVHVTGTTTETNFWQDTIKGGTLGINGRIELDISGLFSGSGGNKTLTLYFGATPFVVFSGASQLQWRLQATISNATATNVQRVVWTFTHGSSGVAATVYNSLGSAAVDTTVDVLVKLTTTLVSTSDHGYMRRLNEKRR